MAELHLMYLIDSSHEFPEDVINELVEVEIPYKDRQIRLYGMTNDKEILKKFKKSRNMDLFLVKTLEDLSDAEIRKTMFQMHKYVISENPYTYRYNGFEKVKIDILSTEIESDYCVYGVLNNFPYMVGEKLDTLVDPIMYALKDEYVEALGWFQLYEIIEYFIDPDNVPPWHDCIHINELNVFLRIFGFTLNSDLKED